MSNKSGVSEQVIALPKGGGALQGIGETFAPDLHTGTGNFTVPITLPPGRNGFQPQLNLVYSTGNPNGPCGLGWSLSIPGVSRKTSDGVPRYRDASPSPEDWDTFLMSGAEDLVPVPGGAPGTARYRPRTEGLFARIEHHSNADPAKDQWEVRTKDGLVSSYGGVDAGGELAAITDPDPPGGQPRLFAWKLTRTADPFGNRIEYVYQRDIIRQALSPSPHHWDQLYLSEIWYVDYGEDPDAPQFLVKVKFDYQPRPDPFSDCRAGFEIRTVRRCTAIRVCAYPDGVETPVRTYQLTYLEPLPPNGVSLLQRIQVIGHDGASTESLPPLEFRYTLFAPEMKREFFPVTGPDLPPGSLAHPDYEVADLVGNGLPDIVEMNGSVRYWRNLGNGRFGRPQQMREAPAGVRLADPGVQLLDANGDARVDLLVTLDGGLSGYYPLRFGGLWDRRSFRRYEFAPSFNLEDPEVRLVDLTGDGVVDAIRSGTRLECFFNHPTEGWTPENTRWVERGPLEDFPNVRFADPRVKWGDMNGDGLQDIVLIHDGRIDYWPSLGHGNWGKRISMRHSPRFRSGDDGPYGYDPRRLLLGDVDGDGTADLVYVDDTKVTIWINQGGNGWSEPITIRGTPSVSDVDAVRLADVTGGGVSGVLWSQDAGGAWRERMYFLDLSGGGKPYLLSEMDSHMGAVTRVEYAPSTRFFLDDQQHPETRWRTPLPFPVQVVARVEVVDAISRGKLTTTYCYHHGYWDGAEREFRGFRRVDQRDTEVFEDFRQSGLHPESSFEAVPQRSLSPPTETRTWFHQGPVGDEFGGWTEPDLTDEFWPGDGRVMQRPASMTAFLESLPRPVRRDALRALRGRVLRTEVYALDGSDRQGRPYTVTEHLHGVMSMPVGAPRSGGADGPEAGRQRVFFPHLLAERTSQWERGDEPLHQFRFTADYDAYGQPQSVTTIAVPRGRNFRVGAAGGVPYLATHTEMTYATRDDADRYIVDRVGRVTTREVTNDGSRPLIELLAAVWDGSASGPVINQTVKFYDGLGFRQLGKHGALGRTEELVLTPDMLHEAYASGTDVLDPPEVPPYLLSGEPAWPAEYPQAFRAALPALAGYRFEPGGAGAVAERGYFAVTEERRYDVQDNPEGKGRGLVKATRDPLGAETALDHDAFELLVTKVTDPAALTTTAVYDYRTMQPREVAGPNGNQTLYGYTPLGLLASITVMGKPNEALGDTPDAPSTRRVYDLTAFADRGQPVSVRTIRRIHHVTETAVSLSERDRTIQTIEYSDGLGRLVQTRTQTEQLSFGDPVFGDAGLPADQAVAVAAAVGRAPPTETAPRVVVSGWRVHDNKGREVERFEPFFSTGWAFAAPADAERGQKVITMYDPRGRVTRTVYPDGAEQVIVYGVPLDLTNPDRFAPTPWETYTYDANDNAGRTHPENAASHEHHWNTPASAVVDALGRTVETVDRSGPNPATDWHTARLVYDLAGNLLSITDALGRLAVSQVHDLARRRLRTHGLDAGLHRTIFDAAGNVAEERDSKGSLRLHAYDKSRRRTRLWARDTVGEPVTLRERIIFGDTAEAGLTAGQAAAAYLRGKVYQHYDEAGLLTFSAYDFKGNVLEKARRCISDATILAAFSPPPADWRIEAFRVDWQPPTGTDDLTRHASHLLDSDAASQRNSITYDALNRITTIRYPQDAEGGRKELLPRYNHAGALERVEFDGTILVEHITYNAKGQRILIAYGNGVMTRYAYDPATFRLSRLRSERFTQPAAKKYQPTGAPLQDFAYVYDLSGNLLKLHDRTPGSGIPNQPNLGQINGLDWLDRAFGYDPLYRLRSATGREWAGPPPTRPWDDAPKSQDPNLTRSYTESYEYDRAGNLMELRHKAGAGSFTRTFALVDDGASSTPANNRLRTLTVGSTVFEYTYDPSGNLTGETSSRHFEWDHADRLRAFRTQVPGSEPSLHVHYLYDSTGMRTKKLVRKQGGQVETTIVIDGLVEHHREVQGTTSRENTSLRVMDGNQPIVLLRVGTAFPGDTTPALKYHLGDHLASSNVVVDETGNWVNREEYTPFGETSFGSFARKRYRFTSQERDTESSLSYHEARYYAPWLARWISSDPAGMLDNLNLYTYVVANPLRLVDMTGTQAQIAIPTTGSSATNQTLKAKVAQSILDVPAGEPLKKYPEKLSVPPDLVTGVQELARDKTVPGELVQNQARDKTVPSQPRVMERAGIITRSGVLYPLTKEEHIRALGRGDWSKGVARAVDTSPGASEAVKLIAKREPDPTVLLAEIDVHTHPMGWEPPSKEDIGGAASATGPFNPSKRMVVNRETIYLMIPTKETLMLAAKLEGSGQNIRDVLIARFSAHSAVQAPGERSGEFVKRGPMEASTITMGMAKLAVYRYSSTSQMFERMQLP
jgi:RHS repeat-associated protein